MFNPYYQPQFVTRQVTNIEEAKAYIIDAINTFLFLDFNSGKIYLKRMNNNGLADFFTFTMEKNAKPDEHSIESRIARLENIIMKRGNNTNESVTDDDESKGDDVSADGKTESSAV